MDSKRQNEKWLITGPTSAGKSTFINSDRCAEITNTPKGTPTLLAHNFKKNEYSDSSFFLHYNTLRSSNVNSGFLSLLKSQDENTIDYYFENDSVWDEICETQKGMKAIVLVSSKATILKRIDEREIIENGNIKKPKVSNRLINKKYPRQFWRKLISSTNMLRLYERWCQELEKRGIPYTLINSENNSYSIISKNDLTSILTMEKTTYTKAKIKKIIKKKVFEYQRIELPYGYYTKGDDRRETRDLIFPNSLEGKSVLDVGCALGYMCFEAEQLGAKRIVGYDLKEKRFEGAKILKDIKSSNVEFHLADIFAETIAEKFDLVLFLNVIHHVPEPIKALRKLAQLTQEKLIIEFPTLNDIKFKKTISKFDESINNLSFIGVSELNTAKQTFVFTPKAIERILMNHDSLFKKIDFFDSPMKDRKIAICYK
jgi:2-polyprenyl-3-methyl-5-hydroxy-6-metoxy-1,4-benzoquinol methylase